MSRKRTYSREEVKKLINKALTELEYPETYYEPIKSDSENERIFKEKVNEWCKKYLK